MAPSAVWVAAVATAALGAATQSTIRDAGKVTVTAPATMRSAAAAAGRIAGSAVNLDDQWDEPYLPTVSAQYGSFTPEDAGKWGPTSPAAGQYDFTNMTMLQQAALGANSVLRYHNYLWHNQMPDWICSEYEYPNSRHCLATPYSAAQFQNFVEQRVNVTAAWCTAQPRYPAHGSCYCADVVNEAINDTSLELWDDVYRKMLGESYFPMAFRLAKAAAPGVITVYNDYWLEGPHPGKTQAALSLVKAMKSQGVPLDAVGFQMHYGIGPGDLPNATRRQAGGGQGSRVEDEGEVGLTRAPTAAHNMATLHPGHPDYKRVAYPGLAALRATMAAFAALGVQLQITELDISIVGGKPADNTSALLEQQAVVYGEVVQACVEQPACTLLATWGFTDKYTWLGTHAAPLPFDVNYTAKPAFDAMVQAFQVGAAAAQESRQKQQQQVLESVHAALLPHWSAPMPNPSLPYNGYPPIVGAVHTEVYHAVPATWTYNHAVMLEWQGNAQPSGRFLLTWKNGVGGEDQPGQRVLYSQSGDGLTWIPTDGTNILFPNMSTNSNHVALFAEPPMHVNGRLYAAASPKQFCLFPDQYASILLMRRVYEDAPGHLGPIFWAASTIPAGFEEASGLNNVTVLPAMDATTQADMALLLNASAYGAPSADGGQQAWMPCNPWEVSTKCEACADGCQDWSTVPAGTENERSHYTIPPSDPRTGYPDVLLYRHNNSQHDNNTLSASVRLGPGQPWSTPVITNIPNQPANLNTGALPDGRRFLLVNPGPARDPLVIATTSDGWDFNTAAAVVSCKDLGPGHCTARYPAPGKDSGSVAYPQGLALTDPSLPPYLRGMWVAYTNNKEDVFVTRLPLGNF